MRYVRCINCTNAFLTIVMSLFLVLLSALPTRADCFWQNADGGSYHDEENWDHLPGSDDEVVFNLRARDYYSVTFFEDVSQKSLLVELDMVEFLLNGTTFTATENVVVGERKAVGFLKISGGTLNSEKGFIDSLNLTSTVTVDGIGSVWNNSSDLYVGNEGYGALDILNGGAVSNTTGYLGFESGATGTVTVDGSGSAWENSEDLYVGYEGDGYLNILNGGAVSSGSGAVGYESGAAGTVTVDGSGATWVNSDNLYVGYDGEGFLTILNGGTVSSHTGYVGYYWDSSGTVTVDGSGSAWNISDNLYVGHGFGDGGEGHLNILNGGAVFNTNGYIGAWDSSGTVTVDGDGSVWNNSNELCVGSMGQGSLNILNKGSVSSTDGYVGTIETSVGTVTVDGSGSAWTNSRYLLIGMWGQGTLNVFNGAAVSSVRGILGYGSGAGGTVTVDGSGSTWKNSEDLYVGYEGSATLNITNDGLVSVGGTLEIGDQGVLNLDGGQLQVSTLDWRLNSGELNWTSGRLVLLGENTWDSYTVGKNCVLELDSGASLTMDAGASMLIEGGLEVGADSTLALSSSQDDSGAFYVGGQGDGTVDILNRGMVSSEDGWVGYNFKSGTVTVDGSGSAWNNSSRLYVGCYGDGTLNILDGGTVSSMDGYLGEGAIALYWRATVTVDGSGSVWNNSRNMYVGYSSDGILDILNGGTVSSKNGYVGYYGDKANGTVTVDGSGSTWTNSNDLYVGYGGSGTLNIVNDGLVFVGGTLTIGSKGQVNMSGGNLIHIHNPLELDQGATISGYGQIFTGTAGLNLNQGGVIAGSGDGLDLWGDLYGSGTVSNTAIHGDIYVGNSPGILELADVELSSGTTLYMELAGDGGVAGTDFDQIVFGGEIDLCNLLLEVMLYGDYVLKSSDSFTLFDFSNAIVSGIFADILLPELTDGLTWDISDLSTLGILSVKAVPLPSAAWLLGLGLLGLAGIRKRPMKQMDQHIGGEMAYVRCFKAFLTIVMVLFLMFSSVIPSQAACYWKNSDGGSYINADNWYKAPVYTDMVTFDLGASDYYSVTFSKNVVQAGLLIGDDMVEFLLDGKTFTADGKVSVGVQSDNGSLKISGGTLSSETGNIGFVHSTGTVTVAGSSSAWTNSSDLYVGYEAYGNGTLNILNGGAVSNATGYVGYESGSVGTVTVDGTGSAWDISGNLILGYEGEGSLNILNGGTVSNETAKLYSGMVTVDGKDSAWDVSGDLYVISAGEDALNILNGGTVSSYNGVLSSGTVTVDGSGSTWDLSGGLTVRYSGEDTLNIVNGGTVFDENGVLSIGTVIVDGSGSTWENSSDLCVGFDGEATLNILNGGTVSNKDGWLSIGTVNVKGSGSTWNNSDNLYISNQWSNTLNITNDGLVSVGGTLTIGGQGQVNLDGGQLWVGTLDWGLLDTGNLNWTSGTLGLLGDHSLGNYTVEQDKILGLGTGATLTMDAGANLYVMESMAFKANSRLILNGGALSHFENQLKLDQGATISGNGQIFTGTAGLNLNHGGVLAGSGDGLDLWGDLFGSGTVSNTAIHGDIYAGNSPGILELADVAFSCGTTLYMDLAGDGGTAGTDFDQIVFSGEADLCSLVLAVMLYGDYTVQPGGTFALFDFSRATVSGTFADILLPELAEGLAWDTSKLCTLGVLSVNAVPLPCTLWLLAAGFAGLVGIRRRKMR